MSLRGVFVVDDAVPRAAHGAGHPRALAVLRGLAALAERVAVVATQPEAAAEAPSDALPDNVEALPGPFDAALVAALRATPRAYDLLWVGRPHNLALVERLARLIPDAFACLRVIYDAEAVFALRDIRKRALDGAPMSQARQRAALRQEFHPAYLAAAIAAVSEAERKVIAEHVAKPVHVLAHPAPVLVPAPSPAGRSGALFVGNLARPDEPNGDSLRWLLGEVAPRLADFRLVVAGSGADASGWLAPLARPGVALLGSVADLAAHYASARVFVAPTRYAAGIPLKVLEATQHGVPVVASPLIADLLGWRDGVELLVGEDPAAFAAAFARLQADDDLWQRMATGAQAALARDYAPARFADALRVLVHG